MKNIFHQHIRQTKSHPNNARSNFMLKTDTNKAVRKTFNLFGKRSFSGNFQISSNLKKRDLHQ